MAPWNKRSRQSFFFLTKSTSVLITSFSATPMGDISRPGIYRDSAVCNNILYPFSIYSPTVLVRNCSCFWLDLYEMAPRKKSSQKKSSFQQKKPSVTITIFYVPHMGDNSRPGIYSASDFCNKILYTFSIYFPTVLVSNCSCFWVDLWFPFWRLGWGWFFTSSSISDTGNSTLFSSFSFVAYHWSRSSSRWDSHFHS